MDENFWDASLHPPVLDCKRADDAGAPGSWAMLDVLAYIADRRNATTAYGRMRNGVEIQVTFCVAPPPVVSYFCVWCPDVTHLAEIPTEPRIIAAEADLVVLRVGFGSGFLCADPQNNDIFVYHSGGGGKRPTLRLIRLDDPLSLFFNVGILRYRNDSIPDDDRYFIVSLNVSRIPWKYNLHIFDSKTENWSYKSVSVQGIEHQHGQFRVWPCKGVMLGEGGLMGFVDLRQGILICDVLGSKALHYDRFPPPLKKNKISHKDPMVARGIAVSQGRIKVVDCFYCSKSCAWKAAVWSREAASMEKDWNRDYSFEIRNNLVDNNTLNFELLPKMQANDDDSLSQKMVEALHIAHPTLSLDSDNGVYFMAKVNPRDKRACVLSVDLKNQRIQDVGVFHADRSIGITLSYIHSRISKYFNDAPV